MKRDRTSSDAYALLREEVHGRENGYCVRCLTYADIRDGECHHRQLRSRGGRDTAWNCIWLCTACHAWVHSHPFTASALGFMVPTLQDAAEWPVLRRTGWFQPSPDGWLPRVPQPQQKADLDGIAQLTVDAP